MWDVGRKVVPDKGTAVSGVGRKVVPDKGRLNRERPVTKALQFPSCTGKSYFFPIRTGTESTRRVYTKRQDDRYSGRVPSKKRKAKVAILKSILF